MRVRVIFSVHVAVLAGECYCVNASFAISCVMLAGDCW